MKWYFAGRVRHQQKLVDIAGFLKSEGELITSEWLYQGSLKPYAENLNKVQALGKEVVKSLLQTDIFVLISDPEGTDMFIELGVCLARKALSEKIKIYIIGEHAKRSLMQLHPDIVHVKDLKALFDLERIRYQNFELPKLD